MSTPPEDTLAQAAAELAQAGYDVTDEATGEQVPGALVAGTFALYDDGRGGFVLVTETTQHGVMRRHIPSAMVKVAGKLASGGGLLSGMFR